MGKANKLNLFSREQMRLLDIDCIAFMIDRRVIDRKAANVDFWCQRVTSNFSYLVGLPRFSFSQIDCLVQFYASEIVLRTNEPAETLMLENEACSNPCGSSQMIDIGQRAIVYCKSRQAISNQRVSFLYASLVGRSAASPSLLRLSSS